MNGPDCSQLLEQNVILELYLFGVCNKIKQFIAQSLIGIILAPVKKKADMLEIYMSMRLFSKLTLRFLVSTLNSFYRLTTTLRILLFSAVKLDWIFVFSLKVLV